mmetsp:Transcript_34988/g.67649  ORF Transcript_34988/g.67649 Transcript_34988/m.67649 type:complete len:80 (+) Transcript_34988:473-712(+)
MKRGLNLDRTSDIETPCPRFDPRCERMIRGLDVGYSPEAQPSRDLKLGLNLGYLSSKTSDRKLGFDPPGSHDEKKESCP